MIKERPRVADDPEVQQLLTSLESELAQERQAHQRTQAELAQKDDIIKRHLAYEEIVYKVVTNTNMTYSDRVIWITVLKNHLEEVSALKPFHVNVARIRTESGASKDTATKFFAAMQEARAIHYHTKSQKDEKNKYSSTSTVTAVAGHEHANTIAAAKRVKQRNEVAERRKKAFTIDIKPCENCGSTDLDDALSAIVPWCNRCDHGTYSQQLMIPTKDIRIMKDIIIHPGHEFSAMTDEDDDLAGLQQPEESFSSHEFQDITNRETSFSGHEFQDDLAATDETDNNSSHEISETGTASKVQTETPSSSHEFQEGASQNDPERVPSSHEFQDMIGETHQEETTISSHEFPEVSPHPEEIHHTEEYDPSHEFQEGTLVQTPVGIGTISRTAYIRNRWRCAVRFANIQSDGTYYAAFDPTEIQRVEQTSLL